MVGFRPPMRITWIFNTRCLSEILKPVVWAWKKHKDENWLVKLAENFSKLWMGLVNWIGNERLSSTYFRTKQHFAKSTYTFLQLKFWKVKHLQIFGRLKVGTVTLRLKSWWKRDNSLAPEVDRNVDHWLYKSSDRACKAPLDAGLAIILQLIIPDD